MIEDKRILAIVPARGGSKGIKNKNITAVKNKPLIAYTLEEAKLSKYIDSIYVSTDNEAIAKICSEHGVKVNELRPKELATDEAKTIDTVLYTIELLKEKGQVFDYVILLQPTQPLRRFFHIDEAIELIYSRNEESLVSVNKVEDHPILIRKLNKDGTLSNLLDFNSTVRRQDFENFYVVNGAIYINKINNSLNKFTSLNDNKLAYLMDRKYHLDIDEPADLKKFESFVLNDYIFKGSVIN
ncbi:acylneuraminate cytidylyltransferase family protein [Lysinibacillus sp. M3]|uniref:Acylneuraminate cytidylyltransferase family protein n=1 Tax=Lysinibacillus zambalensis TaxID=3160866 RepID=A0ABV1MWF6_9BACI